MFRGMAITAPPPRWTTLAGLVVIVGRCQLTWAQRTPGLEHLDRGPQIRHMGRQPPTAWSAATRGLRPGPLDSHPPRPHNQRKRRERHQDAQNTR